ncbi:cupin domain-containing protein [Terrimonas alba]|uniref:cupin domain-containing protein n=1 Tax=Terrimonas alba TaxID=3349636 RepID=UPI0035F34CEA
MKNKKVIVAFLIAVIGGFALPGYAFAQPKGVYRTDLQRHDLSAAGWEVVQARVDIDAGVLAPKHSHPGEEIVYVLEGVLEYHLEGQAPVKLKAGDVLFIPAGVVHSAKNVGKGKGSELATYTVEKGKPLVVYVK